LIKYLESEDLRRKIFTVTDIKKMPSQFSVLNVAKILACKFVPEKEEIVWWDSTEGQNLYPILEGLVPTSTTDDGLVSKLLDFQHGFKYFKRRMDKNVAGEKKPIEKQLCFTGLLNVTKDAKGAIVKDSITLNCGQTCQVVIQGITGFVVKKEKLGTDGKPLVHQFVDVTELVELNSFYRKIKVPGQKDEDGFQMVERGAIIPLRINVRKNTNGELELTGIKLFRPRANIVPASKHMDVATYNMFNILSPRNLETRTALSWEKTCPYTKEPVTKLTDVQVSDLDNRLLAKALEATSNVASEVASYSSGFHGTVDLSKSVLYSKMIKKTKWQEECDENMPLIPLSGSKGLTSSSSAVPSEEAEASASSSSAEPDGESESVVSHDSGDDCGSGEVTDDSGDESIPVETASEEIAKGIVEYYKILLNRRIL
jgi:hypothetical protein